MKEILVIIVLISGLIKGLLLFWGIPTFIDFTLISFLMLLIYSIINYKQFSFYLSIRKTFVFLSIIIFYLWMIFSLVYSSSNGYSYTKTFLFLTNLIPIGFLLFIKEFDHRKFIRFFVLIVFILNLVCLFYDLIYITGKLGNLSDNYYKYLSGNYLVLGELTGLLTLVLICYHDKPVFKNKYFDRVSIFIGICFLLLLSARGPLIFFFFSYLFYLIINSKRIIISNLKISKVFLFLIPVLLVIIILYSSQLISLIGWSFSRLTLLISDLFRDDNVSHSTNVRLIYYSKSLGIILSNIQSFLFGKGIGSYMLEISGFDGRGYPHNIILEIWFEMGLIGLFFFLVFFCFSFLFKISKESKTSWIVFLFIILNLLKSNSLVDIRAHLFFFIF